jgi:capsular polysaccharide biosynthesis protein
MSRVLSRPGWRAVDRLREAISTSAVDRETGVVRLTVSATHPALSEQIAQRLLELLNEFNTEARQSRAQEEGRFIGARDRACARCSAFMLGLMLAVFIAFLTEFVTKPGDAGSSLPASSRA